MTIKDDNGKREMNPASLENLKLGPQSRYQGKKRTNLSLLPGTISWLKSRGNASELIDQMVTAARAGQFKPVDREDSQSDELKRLKAENERLQRQVNQLNGESKYMHIWMEGFREQMAYFKQKIQAKETGYKSSAAGKLIKELLDLEKRL